tara:strand:+ start:36 stop:614 length:579 start_codon:yes stop_codon:yes gene_type:complete
MKKYSYLIVIFLLFFNTIAKADDIRDFEIEGMSIGDSLLDFFSEQTIKKNTKDYYGYRKDFSFIAIEIENHKSLKKYYGVQLHVKKNDKNYILYGINGYNYCKIDINNCYKQTEEIEKEFLRKFKKLDVRRANFKHSADPSKKSNVKGIYFDFDNGDMISINVYDWGKKIGYTDNFDISIDANEFVKAFKNK